MYHLFVCLCSSVCLSPQGLSSMCVCPVGRHVVAISEAGNILIYDAAVLGKDIRQVNYSVASIGDTFGPASCPL